MKEKYYFKDFPILENDRLILKSIGSDDAKDIIEISVYDGFFAKTKEDVLIIQDKINKDFLNGDSILWGVYLKSSGKIVGNCCFCRGYKDNIGEIGYVLKEKYRGQNIMTEAAKMVTEYGLNVMKLYKIVAYTNPDNKASQSVLKKIGYKEVTYEGSDLKYEIKNLI